MIIEDSGRRRSVRTPDEIDRMLGISMGGLTESERFLIERFLSDNAAGMDDALSFITDSHWVEPPVSMEQFLDDEYYLGASCTSLYPMLRLDLIELFDTRNRGVHEVVLGGSIGWGKNMFASLVVCRLLYELSLLRNPQESFGLSAGTDMVFVLVSRNLPLARSVLKSSIDDKIKLSPYFREKFWPDFKTDYDRFPNDIVLQIASYFSERVLGTNVFGGIADEMNFVSGKRKVISATGQEQNKSREAQFDQAEKVYSSIVRRIKSRFVKAGGNLPGKMVLISSATTHNAFIDRKIKASVGDPTVFVREYATWDVKPSGSFRGDKFTLCVGTSSLRSRLFNRQLTPEERVQFQKQDMTVIDVPVEYYGDFERDLENAIRDMAGMSTHAIQAFIARLETIDAAVERGCKRLHPFSMMEYVSEGGGQFMWERLARRIQVKLPGGNTDESWEPLINPGKPRWLHVDPALSGDALGMAMGHVDRMVEVIRRDEDGNEYNDMAPYIVIDFVLRVWPKPGDQIFLGDVRRLVYELLDHGFRLSGFSMDSYQSADTLQQVKRRGVGNSQVVSVDITTTPYDQLKSALYENRIELYQYPPLVQELRALERNNVKHKVDHPVAGSKDVADAVAGVVHGLIKSTGKAPLGMLRGSGDSAQDEDERWILDRKPKAEKPAVRRPLPMPLL